MGKIFHNKYLRPLWLVLRIWLGYAWVRAAWPKVTSPAWVGEDAGTAITGFFDGVLAKAAAERPEVQGWYAAFIRNFAIPNASVFSYLIAYGELIAGIALVLGALTFVALLGSAFMNLNFMLAGTVSTNPQMYTVAILLLAAGANAWYFGVDRLIMPKIYSLYERKINLMKQWYGNNGGHRRHERPSINSDK